MPFINKERDINTSRSPIRALFGGGYFALLRLGTFRCQGHLSISESALEGLERLGHVPAPSVLVGRLLGEYPLPPQMVVSLQLAPYSVVIKVLQKVAFGVTL